MSFRRTRLSFPELLKTHLEPKYSQLSLSAGLHIFKDQSDLWFNTQAPVAQKIADEVVFRRFQGEGVEFL